MNIQGRGKIAEFKRENTNNRAALDRWVSIVEVVMWTKFAEIRQTFQSADVVGDYVVFNIGGNNYRLIARINYKAQIVQINRIMTHAEYDKWQL